MEDIDSLLKEADELGILNIDVDGRLTPEIIRIAIDATKRHKAKQNKDNIKKIHKKVEQFVAKQHK